MRGAKASLLRGNGEGQGGLYLNGYVSMGVPGVGRRGGLVSLSHSERGLIL